MSWHEDDSDKQYIKDLEVQLESVIKENGELQAKLECYATAEEFTEYKLKRADWINRKREIEKRIIGDIQTKNKRRFGKQS